jgi:predicted DNA-binding ribbon-helix-helix protein
MKPSRSLKSLRVKRSVILGGKKTCVNIEDQFWQALTDVVKERQTTLAELVTSINAQRQNANLASAVRVFILAHFQTQTATTRPTPMKQVKPPA